MPLALCIQDVSGVSITTSGVGAITIVDQTVSPITSVKRNLRRGKAPGDGVQIARERDSIGVRASISGDELSDL